MTMAIFTASGEHGKKVNYSSCVTGLDTGVTCDLATFPSSRAKMIQEQDNYCCSLPLAFQEFGVCTENEDSDSGRRGRTRYNVPVCHSYNLAINGKTSVLHSHWSGNLDILLSDWLGFLA